MESYSEYLDLVQNWWNKQIDTQWRDMREGAMKILHEDYKLQRIIKLIGEDALPDNQRLILETVRLLKDSFLQQNAFDEIDTYTVPRKQFLILKAIMFFYARAKEIIKGHLPIYKLLELPVLNDIHRIKENISNDETGAFDDLLDQINNQIQGLLKECMAIYD